MRPAAEANSGWPADVIHVNEDGWVLINRGAQHGMPVGLRLLVVGAGMRELRDLFAGGGETEAAASEDGDGATTDQANEPVVLRTRRTYELLEVVHVEPSCAIAIAARTPVERRPQFYRGPEGDLLVWVPLPADFTYPKPDLDEDELDDEEGDEQAEGEAEDTAPIDTPPQRADQEDERWEEALPLNGVGVGDQVVPAVPAAPAASGTGAIPKAGRAGTPPSPTAASGEPPLTQFEQGRSYDWMKPQS
jgi:hypothetical protein